MWKRLLKLLRVEATAPAQGAQADFIKVLFAKGDDETSRGKAVSGVDVYYESLVRELSLQNVNDELKDDLMNFTREVVMAAGWYQYKYLNARRWARTYIGINVILVIGMPLAIIGFAKVAHLAHVNAVASQIAAVLTGIFALQKVLSAWLASQQNYASWYKASFDLKCLYHPFLDTWRTRASALPPGMTDDLRKATSAAREIIKVERLQFYTAMALPTFDVLSMMTSQRTTVTSLVSGLLPAGQATKPPASTNKGDTGNRDTQVSGTAGQNDSGSNTDTQNGADTGDQSPDTAADANSPVMQPVVLKLPATSSVLTQSVVDECVNCGPLSNAADIDQVFNGNFIDWFNQKLGSNAAFSDRNHIRDDTTTRARFDSFWNQIEDVFGEPSITALQFIALMCIALQENRGNFFANPEIVGNKLHPHLAYAFDRIGTKASYNLVNGNFTAAQLFRNSFYVAAHRNLPGYQGVVTPQIDPAWGGSVWPSHFRPDEDESVNGYIMQADFYKLRGRGVIQTTGRGNYRPLLLFLYQQGLVADHPILQRLAGLKPDDAAWTPRDADLDRVIIESLNSEWDSLFSRAEVLAAGVRVHSMRRGYLQLVSTASVLGASSSVVGSYYRVGASINGGDYPSVVSNRMKVMTEELARLRNPDIGLPRPAHTLEA